MPGGRFSGVIVPQEWTLQEQQSQQRSVYCKSEFWLHFCLFIYEKWPSKGWILDYVQFPLQQNEGNNNPSSSWVPVYRVPIAVLWLRPPLLHAVWTICRLYQCKCDHDDRKCFKIRSPDGEEQVIFRLYSSFMAAAGIMTDPTKWVNFCTESCLILCFTLGVWARPSTDTWGVCWWVIDSVSPYGSKYQCGVNTPGRQLM